MIHKLTLRNFKGIESADLTFERFTVLVGPNASGKTSVLQALDMLSAIAAPKAKRSDILHKYGGPSAIKRGDATDLLVEASSQWMQKSGMLRIALNASTPHELKINGRWEDQDFEVEDKQPGNTISQRRIQAMLKFQPELQQENPAFLKPFLNHWEAHVFLRLDSRNLAEPSYVDSIDPRIDTSGAGLASMLAQMALNRPDDFVKLRDALRAVIPSVVRIRLSLAEVKRQEAEALRVNDELITRHVSRTYSGHRVLFDTQSGKDIPSEAASEGTLLVLGLLAALMSSPRPKLVLLDDLDRGLHPKAQQDLVAQLRELMALDPELQIIATSHSPYLVDHLKPEEVRLSTVLPDGTVRFAALTDHPDFERWKEAMRPGEFWSTVGEKWVGERGGENPR